MLNININNLEWTRYILEACNSDRCPVILAVTPKSVAYFGGYRVVYSVVKSLINDLNIKEDNSFLIKFYENLLLGKNNNLNSKDLIVGELLNK